jgi:hypothetical protein
VQQGIVSEFVGQWIHHTNSRIESAAVLNSCAEWCFLWARFEALGVEAAFQRRLICVTPPPFPCTPTDQTLADHLREAEGSRALEAMRRMRSGTP